MLVSRRESIYVLLHCFSSYFYVNRQSYIYDLSFLLLALLGCRRFTERTVATNKSNKHS